MSNPYLLVEGLVLKGLFVTRIHNICEKYSLSDTTVRITNIFK